MKFGGPPSRSEVRCSALSHCGLVRSDNEDAFGMAPDGGLWVVADGMGGLSHGRLVADRAVAAICGLEPAFELEIAMRQAREVLQQVNSEIWRCAAAWGQGMGATVVVALLQDERLGLLWAGDSRCYRMRRGRLDCLTNDHSVVQRLIDSGQLREDEALQHPMRHLVTRGIGVAEHLELDEAFVPVSPDDVILLCTDGLHGCLGEREIAAGLRRDHGSCAQNLIASALALGASDNVTALTIRI